MDDFRNPGGRRGFHRHARVLAALLVLAVGLGVGLRTASHASARSAPATGRLPVVNFAALLPLTGDLSQTAQAVRVGAELAVEEINEYFSNKGIDLRIGLVIMDTQSDPTVALEKLKTVKQEGFPPIVLGPDSSVEVAAVREYANEHDILIISFASTAPSLAIPGDNVYRMIPDDRLEAEALAILAREVEELPFHADVVVPMYRDDVFGRDLLAAFTGEFTRRGGSVVEPGIAYDPGTRAWDFTGPVRELNRAVIRALAANEGARVAVYLIAFDEATDIFRLARHYGPLTQVLWYGSNGTAQTGALIQDEEAAAFAAEVSFINPTYVPDVDTFQTVPVQIAQIRARIGREPGPFAQVGRETVWLMALAYLRTGLEQPDTAALRSALLNLTGDEGNYRGSIGGLKALLNEAGDVAFGNTGFFILDEGDDRYRWIRRAQLYRSPAHEPYWRFEFEPDPFERTGGHEGHCEPEGLAAGARVTRGERLTGGERPIGIGQEGISAKEGISEERTVTIGALLSLSGADLKDDAGVGDLLTALEFARDDINEYLMNIGSPCRVDLRVEDTQGDPDVGLQGLAKLAAEGISIVVGPIRSAVAAAVLDYANEQGILLLSPFSTAPSLAIPGDNLYRLVPDDGLQAAATAELLAAEGIKAVIPLYAVYGDELVARVSEIFASAGGTVVEGIRYEPDTRDFTFELQKLEQTAAEAIDRYGADAVAVYAVAFEEISAILQAAAERSSLTTIRWYGSDANALHQGLVADAKAGRAAASVRLTSPAYKIDPFDPLNGVFFKDYEVFMARMQGRTGRPVSDNAALSYVAMWWAARADFATGHSGDISALRAALEEVLMPEVGLPLIHITGDTLFNGAGDQTMGHYVFYRVGEENGTFSWREYAVFHRGYELQGIAYR